MRFVGILATAACVLIAASASSHPMMGAITWNRHIARVLYAHCVSCHGQGGSSFPLVEYAQAREAADAIKRAVLDRTMPPWGAVKGFGELRDDQGLSPAEIDLIVEWVETGTARGNNPRALPDQPPPATPPVPFVPPRDAIVVSGDTTLTRRLPVAALFPRDVAADASLQIVAELPDGSVRPLVWLHEYGTHYTHAFRFDGLTLPAGTVIRGVPADVSVLLIPGRR